MKNKVLGTIGFIGFFLLIVSVGGMERYTISLLQGTIQSSIGFLMMFLSGHFAGAMSYQDCRKYKYLYQPKSKQNRECNL